MQTPPPIFAPAADHRAARHRRRVTLIAGFTAYVAATAGVSTVVLAQSKPLVSQTDAQIRDSERDEAESSPPGVAPVSDWQDAANSFRYQDFDNAIPRLRNLLYPKPRLDRTREWKAREYLGAALWWTGKRQESLDELTALLVRNPALHLDPASYPPQMIKDFETLRSNLLRLGVIRAGQKPLPVPAAQAQFTAPLVVCFFPFGVGQFANDQTGKGLAFLGGQLVFGGASVALYQFNRDLGRAGEGNTALRASQVVAGAAFWGLALWGVVDALVVRSDLVAAARANVNAPAMGDRSN